MTCFRLGSLPELEGERAPPMKRDMDLVRKIFFALEDKSYLPAASNVLKIEGYDVRLIDYHLAILSDSPYLRSVYDNRGNLNHYRLSWDGHEFLESIRDDTRWNQLKEASVKASAASIQVIAQAALATGIKLVFAHLGLPI